MNLSLTYFPSPSRIQSDVLQMIIKFPVIHSIRRSIDRGNCRSRCACRFLTLRSRLFRYSYHFVPLTFTDLFVDDLPRSRYMFFRWHGSREQRLMHGQLCSNKVAARGTSFRADIPKAGMMAQISGLVYSPLSSMFCMSWRMMEKRRSWS